MKNGLKAAIRRLSEFPGEPVLDVEAVRRLRAIGLVEEGADRLTAKGVETCRGLGIWTPDRYELDRKRAKAIEILSTKGARK